MKCYPREGLCGGFWKWINKKVRGGKVIPNDCMCGGRWSGVMFHTIGKWLSKKRRGGKVELWRIMEVRWFVE